MNSHAYKKFITKAIPAIESTIYGKLEYNYQIANKKALFHNLRKYYVSRGQNIFDFVPKTFHVHTSVADRSF